MEKISIKSKSEDCEVVYEADFCDSKEELQNNLQQIEIELTNNQQKIDKLNNKINDLTNHADKLDYIIAGASGVISGLIDSFFVGKWSLAEAQTWGTKSVNEFVIKVAKLKNPKVNSLTAAVSELEKYELGSDKLKDSFGGAASHHLFDFTHHCGPSGLFFSLFAQFHPQHLVCGTDVAGNFIKVQLGNDASHLIGKTFSEKIHFGVYNWIFHMASDVAGSQGSTRLGRAGSGLPGPIMSMVKELSSTPLFGKKNSETRKQLSLKISRLFRGMEITENGVPIKFDVRTGVGVTLTLAKMSIPVLINELVVRTFYFIRRLISEIKNKQVKGIRDLSKIDWNKTNPFVGRTITRMMTIASGTFVLVDLVDATIRSATECGGNPYAFLAGFVFRINIIGVGRFLFAVGEECFKETKRNLLRNERIKAINDKIQLLNMKVYYKNKETWFVMEDTEKCINDVSESMIQVANILVETNRLNAVDIKKISEHSKKIKEENPELANEIADILDW